MKITLDLPFKTKIVGLFINYQKDTSKPAISTATALIDPKSCDGLKLCEDGRFEYSMRERSIDK